MNTHRDPSAVQQILDERAQMLARPQVQTDEVQGEELVVFRLGDSCYGLPAQEVKEAYPLADYAPVPGTPAFILGLVNVRGRLLTALDLRPLLSLASADPQPNALLLIVTSRQMEVALLTDAVVDVRHSSGEITPTPSSQAGHGTTWLYGVDRSFTLLIDPGLLLADPRLFVNTTSA